MAITPVRGIVPILSHSELGVFPNSYFRFVYLSAGALWGFLSMKMYTKDFAKILTAVVALSYGQMAFGQTQDDQTFTVTVPSLLSITAPANKTIDTTTDQTDGNKVFTPGSPVDYWTVVCNSAAGATVNLVALSPFTNGASERDARLDLAVGSGGPNWAVTTASASTDYSTSVDTATVQAQSSSPGIGGLALTVTFLNSSYDTLTEGNYVMTVRGTISANP